MAGRLGRVGRGGDCPGYPSNTIDSRNDADNHCQRKSFGTVAETGRELQQQEEHASSAGLVRGPRALVWGCRPL